MAATPVEIRPGIDGLTGCKLTLYACGSDTLANPTGGGDSLTEQTNRKGAYRATVDEALAGLYEAYMVDATGAIICNGVVEMVDSTDVCSVGELAVLTAEMVAAIAAATGAITVTAAQIAAVLSGTALTIQRGDSTTVAFTGLGNISSRTKLWFSLKASADDADAQSLVQITEAGGLLYINGAAAVTSTNGSITVTDATTGAVTIVLAGIESAKLARAPLLFYDLQYLDTTGPHTLTSGNAAVVADITRATS